MTGAVFTTRRKVSLFEFKLHLDVIDVRGYLVDTSLSHITDTGILGPDDAALPSSAS
jgi:hypothetical protein